MISTKSTGLLHDGPTLAQAAAPPATSPWVLVLFIAFLLPPVYFNMGGNNLSLSRVFLLFAFVPLLIRLLSGQAGRIMAVDYLMMFYCGWIVLTYTFHYGTARIALSGITVVEQLGGYLVGRVLIRNTTDYTTFIRTFFLALLILFPFALFELLTGNNIWAALFDPFFSTHPAPASATRMGMERVMSGFEHPILFGLFCSLGIANFFYIYQPNIFKAVAMMLFTTTMTFMSLSSAPLMAVASQALMITWDKATRGRWLLLAALTIVVYVTIDSLSNRTPMTILISTLTFNPVSAWARVAIWDYGSATVLAHPIMGIGLEDWPRPFWLTSSVDNFWLLTSMRHGIPALFFLLGALAFHLAAILRSKHLSLTLTRYRTGYVLALLCLYFTLCTVHIWGGTSSFVFFYIGAGLWLANVTCEIDHTSIGPPTAHAGVPVIAARSPELASASRNRQSALPRSRFPNVHKRGNRAD